MRQKIWCDEWKRKYFGLGGEVNEALLYYCAKPVSSESFASNAVTKEYMSYYY
jgi:hypothetical protein